jgi:SAM-dependent methyltransferase
MSPVQQFVRRLLRLPGVPEARHVTERAVAPYLRADLTSMHATQLEHNHRLVHAEELLHSTAAATAEIERHQPAVLNAIASVNGTARLLRREQGELDAFTRRELGDARGELVEIRDLADREHTEVRDLLRFLTERVDTLESRLGEASHENQRVRSDFEPHVETLAWLLGRVETVRAEMLHELRYGRAIDPSTVEQHILRPEALEVDDIRLNLGCGHLPIDGFVNVDMRPLPGVDVVAAVDDLPVEPGSVAEIFSAHVLEHFPEMELSRRLLPYWVTLLRPGGTFRAVVPDLPSMIQQYVREEIDFESLRQVAYGGQEYEGDFHFTAFTTDRLTSMMSDAGLIHVEVLAEGRPNGDCLEFEIAGQRPL